MAGGVHRPETMKAVVTGGAGFIGANLSEALLGEGHEVHIVDDLATGHRENVPEGAVFHEGSILDEALLAEVFADASVVYHQGALGSVPRSIKEPLVSNEVNITGTLKVLLHAHEAEVDKVVFAASSSAYGDTEELPKVETMTPRPKSPYAVSKLTCEHYCKVFHEVYGLRTTALRYFNVYGPKQDPDGPYAAVIPKFILAALRGDDLHIHGDGEQSRDFTYVADAVQANMKAAASTRADGEVINVGAGERTTVNTLARDILDAVGGDAKVVHGPPREGDVAHSLASLDKARALLGYEPTVPVADGLARTVGWFQVHQDRFL